MQTTSHIPTTEVALMTTPLHLTIRSVPTFVLLSCNDSYRVGVYCNISSAPCDTLYPCLNTGSCLNDKTLATGYRCHCLPGFNGSDCDLDTRPCKPSTCFNNGTVSSQHAKNFSFSIVGTCVNKSSTEFICHCADGWFGIHCETKVNYCSNVTCQNSGVCRSSVRNYTCQCLGNSYSGRYCERKQSALVALQVVGKSFASVAIACLITLLVIFMTLDVLKYGFGIDPTLNDVQQRRSRKPVRKKEKTVPMAVRFTYVN